MKRKVEPLPSSEFDPDAAAVHLDDPLRDREAKPGAALLARVRAVDLLELLEDLAPGRPAAMPGPVSRTATLKAPSARRRAIATSPASVNLIALPTRLSSTWVRRRSSPAPSGRSVGDLDVQREALLAGQRLDRDDHGLRPPRCIE